MSLSDVTALITYYNHGEDALLKCLASLPREMPIVLVDDHSDIPLVSVEKALDPDRDVYFVNRKHEGVNHSLKKTVKKAKTLWVHHVDPHFRYYPNALARAFYHLKKYSLPYLYLIYDQVDVSRGPLAEFFKPKKMHLSFIARREDLLRWRFSGESYPPQRIVRYLLDLYGVGFDYKEAVGKHDREDDIFSVMKAILEQPVKDARAREFCAPNRLEQLEYIPTLPEVCRKIELIGDYFYEIGNYLRSKSSDSPPH